MDTKSIAAPASRNAGASHQVALAPNLTVDAFTMRFAREEEIYGEQEPAQHVYKVVSGAVRTFTIDEAGVRQIESFYLPGDVFGFESDARRQFSAEAVSDVELAVVSRANLMRAAHASADAAAALWTMTADALRQAREHMLVLGKKSAADRVVAFLQQMAGRLNRDGVVELPMSRTDIADYLGLTIETVSRSFSRLERARAIALNGARQVGVKGLLKAA